MSNHISFPSPSHDLWRFQQKYNFKASAKGNYDGIVEAQAPK
jgi:hypothetical protein